VCLLARALLCEFERQSEVSRVCVRVCMFGCVSEFVGEISCMCE